MKNPVRFKVILTVSRIIFMSVFYFCLIFSHTYFFNTNQDSGDFMVFKNEINSFENPNEVITRRSQVKIGFSCQYPKVASVSNHYINKKSDYIFTESSFGTFSYSFNIFTDNNFSSPVDPSLYPLEINLLDMLYMGIAAHSALPEVQLFVESCRATPDDNPYSALFYDIIKEG